MTPESGVGETIGTCLQRWWLFTHIYITVAEKIEYLEACKTSDVPVKLITRASSVVTYHAILFLHVLIEFVLQEEWKHINNRRKKSNNNKLVQNDMKLFTNNQKQKVGWINSYSWVWKLWFGGSGELMTGENPSVKSMGNFRNSFCEVDPKFPKIRD